MTFTIDVEDNIPVIRMKESRHNTDILNYTEISVEIYPDRSVICLDPRGPEPKKVDLAEDVDRLKNYCCLKWLLRDYPAKLSQYLDCDLTDLIALMETSVAFITGEYVPIRCSISFDDLSEARDMEMHYRFREWDD